LALARLPVRPGHLAALAAFWPHRGAQRCQSVRTDEQHSTWSTDIGAGRPEYWNTLRIRRSLERPVSFRGRTLETWTVPAR
jgi:hypothetical protein